MSEVKTFETFQEAFDYVREKDAPQVVEIQGDRLKLYPSGLAYKVIPKHKR